MTDKHSPALRQPCGHIPSQPPATHGRAAMRLAPDDAQSHLPDTTAIQPDPTPTEPRSIIASASLPTAVITPARRAVRRGTSAWSQDHRPAGGARRASVAASGVADQRRRWAVGTVLARPPAVALLDVGGLGCVRRRVNGQVLAFPPLEQAPDQTTSRLSAALRHAERDARRSRERRRGRRTDHEVSWSNSLTEVASLVQSRRPVAESARQYRAVQNLSRRR
jgi:hypothetical protein